MAGGSGPQGGERPGELVGVTLGNDLSRVIPSELANWALPALRAVFAARYVAGPADAVRQPWRAATGQGAIIACVDSSLSMSPVDGAAAESPGRRGPRRARSRFWTRPDRRGGTSSASCSPPKIRSASSASPPPASRRIGQVLDFAENFLGGGTDFEAPLTTAGEVLDEEFNAAGRRVATS